MNILNKLKQVATKEVIGSVINAAPAPAGMGKKSKAAVALTTFAAIATAVAQYL